MAALSVVLATFNEEKNLPYCLASVEGLADEIVVVDGGSKDRTVEIAKKYGAKVVTTDNPPIFHINKQKAIDMATCDWILQLDADEQVTPELANEIKSEIRNLPAGKAGPKSLPADATHQALQAGEIDGYWIPRKNWFLGRFLTKGGQYPDYTLRLYRRGKGKLPQKSVHEQAIVEGKTGYLKNPLIHNAYPNFSRYLYHFNRYTDLIRNEIKDKKIGYNPIMAIKYVLVLPIAWFFMTYIRHKGFMDSWQGFVFSFFSALRFPVAYIKYVTSI